MKDANSKFDGLTYFRGRVAMAEALKAAGVQSGDQVAVQALTCVAVAEAVMAIGAKPCWIDVDPDSVTMSAEALAEAWSDDIKAVVVQHTFGVMSDMRALLRVIDGRVPVIEDCCHTLTSSLDGTLAGEFGLAAFYSFEWGKPIILGTGGAAAMHDEELRAAMVESRSQFQHPKRLDQVKLMLQRAAFTLLYRPSFYWTIRAIFRSLSKTGLVVGNYNPVGPDMISGDFRTTMSPSTERRLNRAMMSLETDSNRRIQLAQDYSAVIGVRSAVTPIKTVKGSHNVLVRYPIQVADKEGFLKQAEANRIEAAGWYASPVHPLTESEWPIVGYGAGSCPNAEHMAKHLVSFPMGRATTSRTLRAVAEILPQ